MTEYRLMVDDITKNVILRLVVDSCTLISPRTEYRLMFDDITKVVILRQVVDSCTLISTRTEYLDWT